jgi:hypothetical protein
VMEGLSGGTEIYIYISASFGNWKFRCNIIDLAYIKQKFSSINYSFSCVHFSTYRII